MPQTYAQMSEATKARFLITKKEWYKKNQAKHQAYNQKHKQSKIDFIQNFKLSRGCKICGYKENAVALDLHHRDPSQKEFAIGSNTGYCLAKIKKEIKKCDVLCANCHRIHHHSLPDSPHPKHR